MDISYYRRQQRPPTPASSPSPRLIRSRSGGSATTLASMTSPGGTLSATSQRFNTTNNRSKSTTRTRPNNNYYKSSTTTTKEEDHKAGNTTTNSHYVQKKSTHQERDQSVFTKFLQRGTLRGAFGAAKGGAAGPKAASGSPSAWALSPARSLPFASPVAQDSSPGLGRVKSKSSGGVNGVLKYFRQKKVSPVQEEDFHRFRILHNGFLQWRFANARAEAAIAATQRVAESKLFSVWLRIFKMRNSIMERRIQVQKLKHDIKLYQILNPQILLLNDWAKLEGRNQESVGKLVTKLSGISVKLPLIHGAKADVMAIYEAICMAVEAMDGIEAIITKYFAEVERILYMVTELLITKKQHKDNFEELEKSVTYVTTLVAKETSLRSHYIEAALESVRCQNF